STGENIATDLFFLAMCHARRGQAGEAKKCLDRAAAWMQESEGRLQPQAKQELDAFRAEAQELLQAKTAGTLKIVPRSRVAASGSKMPNFGHTGPVSSVALSEDGQRLLTRSADQTAILWDAQSGTKLCTLTGHTDVVSSVALSRDGQRVLTGSFDFT